MAGILSKRTPVSRRMPKCQSAGNERHGFFLKGNLLFAATLFIFMTTHLLPYLFAMHSGSLPLALDCLLQLIAAYSIPSKRFGAALCLA